MWINLLIAVKNILIASISPLWVKITDFGVSKRWAGTALRTQCGTAVYQAPELIGLLPKRMKTEGQNYSWSVDIWALGAIIHEVLTSQIAFLEIGETMGGFTGDSMDTEPSIDGELMLDYCAGRVAFPIASLTMQGVSANGIEFVKSLMAPNPKERASAADALQSVWFAGMASSATSNLETAGPMPTNVAELTAQGWPRNASFPQTPSSGAIAPPSGAIAPPSGAIVPHSGAISPPTATPSASQIPSSTPQPRLYPTAQPTRSGYPIRPLAAYEQALLFKPSTQSSKRYTALFGHNGAPIRPPLPPRTPPPPPDVQRFGPLTYFQHHGGYSGSPSSQYQHPYGSAPNMDTPRTILIL